MEIVFEQKRRQRDDDLRVEFHYILLEYLREIGELQSSTQEGRVFYVNTITYGSQSDRVGSHQFDFNDDCVVTS